MRPLSKALCIQVVREYGISGYGKKTDLINMNLLLLPRMIQAYAGIAFMTACAAFGGYKIIENQGFFYWFGQSFIVALLVFVPLFLFIILVQALTASPKKGTVGATKYILNSEYFIEETQGTETKTKWESISDIYHFKKYLFIKIDAMRIHIIPKREVGSCKDFESICSEVNRLFRDK